MNVDGTFEFYKFIWDGVNDGWGVYSYPPMKGVKLTFSKKQPSAVELKAIRENWDRFQNKPVTTIKEIVGKQSFVFGKWNEKEAEKVCKKLREMSLTCEITDVPDYSIVNMTTSEAAQIRSDEVYDKVVHALIRNGAEVIPHSGIYHSGAISTDNVNDCNTEYIE